MAMLDNLVAYWPLNEESGNRADVYGSYNLTDNNTVLYAAGKLGNAADFEASNSESLSRSDAGLVTAGSMTFAAWIKPETLGNYAASIWNGYGSNGHCWALNVTSTPRLYYSYNGVDYPYKASTRTISTGTWYFIAVWHNATTDYFGIKVNGYASDTVYNTQGLYTGYTKFALGSIQNAGTPVDFYDGLIDDAALWHRALSDAELDELYNSGNGVGLAAYMGGDQFVGWF